MPMQNSGNLQLFMRKQKTFNMTLSIKFSKIRSVFIFGSSRTPLKTHWTPTKKQVIVSVIVVFRQKKKFSWKCGKKFSSELSKADCLKRLQFISFCLDETAAFLWSIFLSLLTIGDWDLCSWSDSGSVKELWN